MSNNQSACNVAFARCDLILWVTCWVMFHLMLYCRFHMQQHRATGEPSSCDIVSAGEMSSALTPRRNHGILQARKAVCAKRWLPVATSSS